MPIRFFSGPVPQVSAGDVVVFPPRSQHGLDVSGAGRVYCLQMMLVRDTRNSQHALPFSLRHADALLSLQMLR